MACRRDLVAILPLIRGSSRSAGHGAADPAAQCLFPTAAVQRGFRSDDPTAETASSVRRASARHRAAGWPTNQQQGANGMKRILLQAVAAALACHAVSDVAGARELIYGSWLPANNASNHKGLAPYLNKIKEATG